MFVIGEKPGMAQTMKLANNFLSASAMAATAEAVAMGVKAGLDAAVMIDVINAGSGRSRASDQKFPQSILPRTFNYGFGTALMLKDVRLCNEEAKALDTPKDVMSAVLDFVGGHQRRIRRRQRFHRDREDDREARRRHHRRGEKTMSDDIHEVYAVKLREPRAQAFGELHVRRSA